MNKDSHDLDIDGVMNEDGTITATVSCEMDDEFHKFFGKHETEADYLRVFRQSVLWEMKRSADPNWWWHNKYEVIETTIKPGDGVAIIECIIKVSFKKKLIGHLRHLMYDVITGMLWCVLYFKHFISYLLGRSDDK